MVDPRDPTRTVSPGGEIRSPAMAQAEGESLAAGTRIGRYLIRRCIDRGGMGIVYEATDEMLDRRVAVKLLLPRATERDPRIAARLVREARAAASLSHPNVVSVYDIGHHELGPFLAMEYIDGVTLRQWLKAPRSPAAVLRVFVEAGRGLAAAHRAGIVHRDVKPDNILVGDDRARVADFGLALSSDSTDEQPVAPPVTDRGAPHRLTETGTVLGTPRYMAPEQRAAGPASARSDQFSFCLSLVEALTGRAPSPDSAADGESLAGLPARLRRTLARGLERDPEARWPSMNALLAELDPHPHTRRRVLVAAGAILLGGAAVFGALAQPRSTPCQGAAEKLAGIWDGDVKARIAAAFQALGLSYAQDSWRAVERSLDRYAADWTAMHAEACMATRVRGEQSEELLDRRMACLDQRRQGLEILARSLASDAAAVEKAPLAAEGLPPVADCADVGRMASTAAPGSYPAQAKVDEDLSIAALHLYDGREVEGREVAQRAALAARANGDHLREAEAMVVLGRLGLESGDVSPAIVALSTAAEAARSAGAIAVQIEAWTYLAQAYGKAGNHASAQGVLDLAFAAWRSHPDPRLEARLLLQRGIHHGRSGRFEDSRRDLERSLSLDMQALGPDAQSHRAAHLNLSICLRRLGRLEEALAHSRRQLALARLLGDEHPGVARAGREVGVVLSAMGRYEQALAEYQRAGAVYRKAYGEQNEGVSSVESSLGTLYSRMGRWREALAHARTAYAIRQAIGGDVAAGLMLKHNLGSELVMVGEVAEGERLLREVLAERIRRFGPSHPDVASTSGELCGAIFYAGRVDEALRQCEEARRLFATAQGEESPSVGEVLGSMAEAQRAKGRFAAALALDRRASKIFTKALPEDHPLRVRTGTSLAFDELGLGTPAHALPLAAGALAFFASRGDPAQTGVARWALARALWDTGRDRDGALGLARTSLADLEQAGTPHLVPEIERWLATR